MPFTMEDKPDFLNQFPKELQEQWVATFNSAITQNNDEGTAFRIANSILNKAGWKKVGEEWVKVDNKPEEPKDVKESNVDEKLDTVVLTESIDTPSDESWECNLKESNYNADSAVLDNVILIEKGYNPKKRRYYPEKTIQEVASKFSGVKMMWNHATDEEKKKRPEGDMLNWASTIIESNYQDGKAIAKIEIIDEVLEKKLKKKSFREGAGLSINASGKVSYGNVNGKKSEIVESIILEGSNGLPATVDWVTEAGARGRVIPKAIKESNVQENKMDNIDLKTFNIRDIQESRPDVWNNLKKTVLAELEESNKIVKLEESITDLNKQLEEANASLTKSNETVQGFKDREKQAKQTGIIDKSISESDLPDFVKAKIKKLILKESYDNEEILRESITSAIEEEREYARQFNESAGVKMPAKKLTESDSLMKDTLSTFGLE